MKNLTLKVQDEVFHFKLNKRTMSVINKSEAERLLMYYDSKFKEMIRNNAVSHSFYVHGMSPEDFVQEMRITLYESIGKYDETRGAFSTFIWTNCINRLRDILKTKLHTREIKKHAGKKTDWIAKQATALNTCMSLSRVSDDEDGEEFDLDKDSALADSRYNSEYAALADFLVGQL